MQYVGRFVSSVYNTITPNINPATLSGAIDVIVVERQVEKEVDDVEPDDGGALAGSSPGSQIGSPSGSSPRPAKKKKKVLTTELASTPFHVRFGKMSVLRPAERKVTLHLNNAPDPLPFAMKVGEAGEAFFVVELDAEEANQGIPDELVTSPILSATTSPDVTGLAPSSMDDVPFDPSSDTHRGVRKLIAEDYVEPLDLGVPHGQMQPSHQSGAKLASSETGTIRSGFTRSSEDTALTSPSIGGASAMDENTPKSGKKDGAGEGNDKVDEKNTFLENVSSAASKASGVLGAAGASVMPSIAAGGGRNAKLEKLSKQNERRDKASGVVKTGANVESSGSAHTMDSNEHSKTKERMQRQDEEHPPNNVEDARNETERLEIQLRDRAQHLVDETIEARKEKENEEEANNGTEVIDVDSDDDRGSEEERYPAPFGGSARVKNSSTYSTAQPNHEKHLAGHKLKPVRSGLPGRQAVEPAQVDSRITEGRLKHWRAPHPKTDQDDAPLHPEADDIKKSNMHLDGNTVPTLKGSRKEDLQYMLDMDGYKMTTDGEDLAFAEGSRLSHELPLSTTHGGNLRSDTMDEDMGNKLSDEAKESQGKGNKIRHPPAGENAQPFPTKDSLSSAMDELDANLRRDHDASGISDGERSTSRSKEEETLGRDLVRLTRSLHEIHVKDKEESTRASSRAGPYSIHRRQSRRSHYLDGSVSDTETDDYASNLPEVTRLKSSTSGATSSATKGSSHQRALSMGVSMPSMTDNLDGPIVRDDAALGLSSSELDWKWGTVPRSNGRRQRVLSSADVPDENLADFSDESDLGRLSGNPNDPYKFNLLLGNASHTFSMSLCNIETPEHEVSRDEVEVEPSSDKTQGIIERFDDNKISYQRFLDDENVVNDERLVVLYNGRYLTWENASTVLATLSLYRKTLGASMDSHHAALADTDSGRQAQGASVWRRWWYRNRGETPPAQSSSSSEAAPAPLERANTDSVLDVKAAEESRKEAELLVGQGPLSEQKTMNEQPKVYAKTLRLTSDQLKSLNLRKGANTITFSVTSSFSGVATCTARIFLWDSSHKIVVSDIDGTITKSDALGHVFTMIGRDWTHSGVAKLYTDVARNGYRIMYLTSRAIGQADTTRDYLRGIVQSNYKLPDGPVIMSPDRLMASLHREVILRKPEVFKMACLRDIARLFGADPRQSQAQSGSAWPHVQQSSLDAANGPGAGKYQSPGEGAATFTAGADPQGSTSGVQATPFYAGFGNRITDALSYRSVNIPSSRIFTIDSNGEVKMELLELAGYKSSYIHMTDLVDVMFPPISHESSKRDAGKPEFNDFNYWRSEIEEFELPADDELASPIGSSPTSPALSARSVRSAKSNTSLRSATSNSRLREEAAASKQNGTSGPSGVDEPASPTSTTSRLSRFGLGKLGLSRRGSSQTMAAPSSSASTSAADREGGDMPRSVSEEPFSSARTTSAPTYNEGPTAEAARRVSPPSSPASYGSSVTSWTSNWRRRGTSPGAPGAAPGSARPTSPLVGPVISADPEDIDDENDADEGEEDDDVSSFEGDRDDDDVERDGEGASQDGSVGAPQNGRRRTFGGSDNMGDDVMDDDDPLLAMGEIRFEWRG